MRREAHFGMPREEALAFLTEAPMVHLATTTPDGRPVLRVVNFAIVDGRLCFHGAPVGEKTLGLGREVVLGFEETVAFVPSWFLDPERACPATTYYRSVQAHGVLEVEEDPPRKARALEALMQKHQPEGKHVPLDATHALYQKALRGVLVISVSLDAVRGKAKLGQHRPPAERARIVEHLWRRGAPGDARACALILEASPDTPVPAFLRFSTRGDGLGQGGEQRDQAQPLTHGGDVALVPHLHTERDLAAAVRLLEKHYWNTGRFDRETLAAAHRSSAAWVGARDKAGELVATARATGDGAKHTWVYDVAVREDLRGRGIGEGVVRLLLNHPSVRGAAFVHLGTRDAQGFYARLGFRDAKSMPARPYATTTMTLAQSGGSRASES